MIIKMHYFYWVTSLIEVFFFFFFFEFVWHNFVGPIQVSNANITNFMT